MQYILYIVGIKKRDYFLFINMFVIKLFAVRDAFKREANPEWWFSWKLMFQLHSADIKFAIKRKWLYITT